jgi:glycosyltransferase involved in cell wall biosynthesis
LVDVSVVINAYKRRSFVKEAIISAALQNVPKNRYEIILVTDLNDDELDDLVAPYGHVIHYSNERGGAMYAKGIAEASGKVVAFLDDDDMFIQGKLKRVLEAYESSNSLGLYRHNVTFVNEKGEPLIAPDTQATTPRQRLIKPVASFAVSYSQLGRLVVKIDPARRLLKDTVAVLPSHIYTKNLKVEVKMFTREEKEKVIRYLAEEVHKLRPDLYDPLYWLGFNSSSMTALREPLLSYLDDISRFYYAQDNAYVLIFLASDYGIVHEPLKLTLYRVHGHQIMFRHGNDIAFIKKACNEYLELRRLVEELKLEGLIDIDRTEAGGIRASCEEPQPSPFLSSHK